MREKITQAIQKALVEIQVSPFDINCGLCEEFALHVITKLQGKETDNLYIVWIEDIIDTPFPDASHAVICWDTEDGRIFFDSECPNGTNDLSEIPSMKIFT